MDKIQKEISRRNLFRYLGNSIVYLPFMRTLMETQAFGETANRRSVMFFYPDGIIPGRFHPSAVGTSFSLPQMTAPLASVLSEIVMIKNLYYNATNSHQGGARYGITGYSGGEKMPSIDAIIGDRLKGQIPVLRLGVATSFEAGAEKQICFDMQGNIPTIEQNPTNAFNEIFGGSAPVPNPGTQNPTAPVAVKGLNNSLKKSLLDANLGEIKSLQSKLGAIEKDKMSSHVEAIRELERRLQAVTDPGNGGGGDKAECKRTIDQKKTFPANGGGEYPKDIHKSGNFDVITNMMIDITIQALACGVTRSVYLQLSHGVSNIKFANGLPADGGGDHHDASHYGGIDSANGIAHTANQAYMMGKFAKLIKGMAAVKEGDKTLLYNSVCMAFSELGDSDAHSFSQMGTVLAGQAGGFFKTGRCVDAQGKLQNNVLASVLQSMGIDQASVGSEKFEYEAVSKANGGVFPKGGLDVLKG